MQASVKKGKHTSTLKNVQSEQLSKLQQKHQQELDLLDDIRLFSKQRASIEKEYAQAMVKMGEQFLSRRKFPPAPSLKSEDGKDYKTIWAVWKTVLEETRRVGEMRLQAADTYLQQISEPAKPLKSSKSQVAKKVFEQCGTLQRELSSTVQEMNKSSKVYSEEEHLAHEARVKATEADAKVKNRSTGLFTSLAKLQQASNKLNLRREGCEVKSASARNDYLINLAAANAHSSRFYTTDLPLLIKTLDGEMYENVQEYFTTLARSELECCGLTQECFMKILTDSCLVSREFNLQCFLNENQVFTECVQYSFEAQEDDPVETVTTEHNATGQIESETRKWTFMLAQENNKLKNGVKNLHLVEEQIMNGDSKSFQSHDSGKGEKNEKCSVSSLTEPEQRLEDIRNSIRKAETGKLKAEAVLETLKSGGVDIDVWMEKAEAEVAKLAAQEEEEKQKAQTSPKTAENPPAKKTERRVSESVESRTSQSASESAHPTTYINYEEEDYVDDTFDSHSAARGENTSLSTGYASMTASSRTYPLSCVALYAFQAANSDELDLTEHEQLEVIGDGEGDGWVRARKTDGVEGLVPENYIHIYTEQETVDQNEMNVDGDMSQQTAAPEVTQVNASWDTTPTTAQSESVNGNTDTLGSGMSTYSSTDYEVQRTVAAEQANLKEGEWVKAMYDYDATCPEELSFQEGQLIRLTRRDENGVDDGWWEGELNGRVGVFPSLVVEELSAASHTHADGSSDRPGPPAFLPPPPQLEVTLPSHTHHQEGNELVENLNEKPVAPNNNDGSKGDEVNRTAVRQRSDDNNTSLSQSQVTVEADVHALHNTSTNQPKTNKKCSNSKIIKDATVEDDNITFADDDNNESVI